MISKIKVIAIPNRQLSYIFMLLDSHPYHIYQQTATCALGEASTICNTINPINKYQTHCVQHVHQLSSSAVHRSIPTPTIQHHFSSFLLNNVWELANSTVEITHH